MSSAVATVDFMEDAVRSELEFGIKREMDISGVGGGGEGMYHQDQFHNQRQLLIHLMQI